MNAIEQMLQQPLAQRIGWGLLHSLWQAAAVGLLLGGLLRLLRLRSPQARYLTACAALGVMVLLPVLTAALTPLLTPPAMAAAPSAVEPHAPPAPLPAVAIRPAGPAPVGPAERLEPPAAPSRLERLSQAILPVLPHVVAAWMLGMLALSLWRAAGWARVRQLKTSGAEPVAGPLARAFAELARRLGVSRPVRLMRSAAVHAPLVIGWVRCVVLLPAQAMTGLTEAQLRAVLAHELAHVRRYDYLVNLIQAAVETLLFYHPAVWWVSRRIRQEREHCCDDVAATACGDRVLYARALVMVEELRQRPVGLAVAAGGGTLLGRVRRLMGAADDRPRRWGGWLAGAGVLAVVAAVGLVAPLARSAGQAGGAPADSAPPGLGRDSPRLAGNPAAPEVPPGQADRVVPKLEFSGIPLADAIQFLRDVSSVRIDVNWKALRAANVHEKSPVNVNLTRVTLDEALRAILEDVDRANRLAFMMDQGVITISTQEDLARRTVVRVYDIRDLLVVIPQRQGVPPGLAGPGDEKGRALPAEGTSPEELVKNILDLIRQTIAPDTWKGEKPTASIHEMNGQLVVTQTRENHQSLLKLLKQLRSARAVQVMLEVAVVERGDAALLKGLGAPPRRKPAGGDGPMAAPGDDFKATFLSEEQANALLAKAKDRCLKAPQLLIVNGQRAFIDVTVRQTVSLPVTGGTRRARVAYRAGTVVNLAPTVTADQRHINVTVDADHARLLTRADGPPGELVAKAACTVTIPNEGRLLLAIPARQYAPALKETKDPQTGETRYELVRGWTAKDRAAEAGMVLLLIRPKLVTQLAPAEPAAVRPMPAGAGIVGPAQLPGATRPTVPAAPAEEVYIMGDVQRPGVYSVTGRKLTLLQLLAAAGFQPDKQKKMAAVLIRRQADGAEQRQTLDIDAILTGKQADVLLEANDLLWIRHEPEQPHEAGTRRMPDTAALQALRVQEAEMQTRLDHALRRLGPEHRTVKSLEGVLEALRRQIAQREAELKAEEAAALPLATEPAGRAEAAPERPGPPRRVARVAVYKLPPQIIASLIQHRNELKTAEHALKWLAELVRREAVDPGLGRTWEPQDVVTVALRPGDTLLVAAPPGVQAAVRELLGGLPGNLNRFIDLQSRFIRLPAAEEARLWAWLAKEAAGKAPAGAEVQFMLDDGTAIEKWALLLDAKTLEELLRRTGALQSVRTLTAPRLRLLSYVAARLSVGQQVPLKLPDVGTGAGEELIHPTMGTLLKVYAHLRRDGKAVVVRAEPEVRELISAKTPAPVEARAFCEGRAVVPEGRTLLVRMPLRRYRLIGFSQQPGPDGKDVETHFHRELIDPEARPDAYVYVLITPALARPGPAGAPPREPAGPPRQP